MMSTESPPARKAASRPATGAAAAQSPPLPLSLRLLDWVLIGTFLGLVFLLGVFPLKDTDFWWHLRTGDWIRQNGQVPTHDLYTFTASNHPWVDLHWIFQVALSWGYAHGGVPALNLAKCAITVLALVFLLSARARDWPIWVMLLAWLPALLVLSGRMYVRPETLTLLYLSAVLAILFHWERHPALAWALPLVQLAWVNTQGLFVLGPIAIAFALVAALLRPDTFAPERKRWWRTAAIATFLTGAACLVNPYGITGALYPLQLARTMGNPVFSATIAELTPIPEFIKRNMGWSNVPLRFHVAAILVGAVSFVLPLLWAARVRLAPKAEPAADPPATAKAKKGKKATARAKSAAETTVESSAHALVFRVLLFAAFTALSWQATRNSHQFAAVVGAVTAWNFAEWGAAMARRRAASAVDLPRRAVLPRLATLACLVVLIAAVASGKLYAISGEGRTVGLGEEPLWYPHEAVKFAGRPEMPERFLSFHDGYAALYEYHNGPERKVFADARLEVMGPELYTRYIDLRKAITFGRPQSDADWSRELDGMERPAVLAGHVDSAPTGATLMASAHWRCVWFDPIAAVFVHNRYADAIKAHEVDFAARHFRPEPAEQPAGSPALLAAAKGLWNYASGMQMRGRPDLARPLILLGLDYARRLREADPESTAAWKVTGQLEWAREAAGMSKKPGESYPPRFRLPFDPVFDLSLVRATYALRRVDEANPGDFMTLSLLEQCYAVREMDEARLPVLERLVALRPINLDQDKMQRTLLEELPLIAQRLAQPVSSSWQNLSELDRVVGSLLTSGRAASAADILERAYPAGSRTWEITDRIAIQRLHLGEPARARALWASAASPPQPAVRLARLAVTHLVEANVDEARRLYHEAIREDGELFEAHYGLAVLEEDAGNAPEAQAEALKAVRLAPSDPARRDVARSAAQVIVNESAPFARRSAKPIEHSRSKSRTATRQSVADGLTGG